MQTTANLNLQRVYIFLRGNRMTEPRKFKNESQDARRRDQHNVVHPEDESKHSKEKGVSSRHHKRK